MKRIEEHLSQDFNKEGAQEIHQAIKELEALLAPAEKDEMQPSIEEFNKLANECEEIIDDSEPEKAKQRIEELENIMKGAEEARHMKNKRKWSFQYEKLKKLYTSLQPDDPPPQPELPPTEDLKDIFHEQCVVPLQGALAAKIHKMEANEQYDNKKHGPRVEDAEKEIKKLQNDINSVDDQLDPQKALPKLQRICKEKRKKKLMELINVIEHDTIIA